MNHYLSCKPVYRISRGSMQIRNCIERRLDTLKVLAIGGCSGQEVYGLLRGTGEVAVL